MRIRKRKTASMVYAPRWFAQMANVSRKTFTMNNGGGGGDQEPTIDDDIQQQSE